MWSSSPLLSLCGKENEKKKKKKQNSKRFGSIYNSQDTEETQPSNDRRRDEDERVKMFIHSASLLSHNKE